MSTEKGRKHYSKEFKENAVRLVLEGTQSQVKIAKELCVNVNSLHKWKKAYLDSQDPVKVNQSEAELEIKRLKKELREARLEAEILKKAVGYFSKDQSSDMPL